MATTKKPARAALRIGVAAVVLIALVLAGAGIYTASVLGAFNIQPTSEASENSVVGKTKADDNEGPSQGPLPPELQEELVITSVPAHLECYKLVPESIEVSDDRDILIKQDIGALLPVGYGGRATSDSITHGMTTSNKFSQRNEIWEENCTNAHFLAMNLNSLANYHGLGDLNEWLTPYKGDPLKIVAAAAEELAPQLDEPLPWSIGFQEDYIEANLKLQELAAKVNTLLTKFELLGVASDLSETNVHLAEGGALVGGMPPVEYNPREEDLAALQFALTIKDGDCIGDRIGYNLTDMRFETFIGCESPPPPTHENCVGMGCFPPEEPPCPPPLVPNQNGACVHPKPAAPEEWVGPGIEVGSGEYTGDGEIEVETESSGSGGSDSASNGTGTSTGGQAGGGAQGDGTGNDGIAVEVGANPGDGSGNNGDPGAPQ